MDCKPIVNKEYGKRRNSLLCKTSKAESHFAKLLDKSGVYYIREKCCYNFSGEWCYVDFYIPKFKLGIEIDGKEHNTTKHKIRDRLKSKFLDEQRGIFTYRITNEQCLLMNSINVPQIYQHVISKSKTYKHRTVSAIEKEREYFFSICQPLSSFDVRKKIYAYCKLNEVTYEFNNLFGLKRATAIRNKYLISGINSHDDIFYSSIFIYAFDKDDLNTKIDKFNEYLWTTLR